jgi:iron complex outermembrane recepter protein
MRARTKALATVSAFAVLGAGMLAEPAQAQDSTQSDGQAPPSPEAESQDTVEEIVVTAQFREQNLQQTPLAITAMSGGMLEARSQNTIAEVAAQAPSVTLKPNSAYHGPSLAANIRGVGQFDFHPALEPGVGLYVDDVYYSTLTGSILDLLDLDRVEISRGPQGTLAGKNSIGGSIKLYSRRPQGDGSGFASVTYGSRDRLDLRGAIDIGLAPGAALRIAGVSRNQDGYVDRLDFGCVFPAGGGATYVNNAGATALVNPAGGIPALRDPPNCLLSREGEVGFRAARAQFRYEATPDLEFNIIGDVTREKHAIAGSVLTEANYTGPGDTNPWNIPFVFDSRFICGPYCNYSTYESPADGPLLRSVIDGQVDFKGWGVSGQAEWRISDALQLVGITAYRWYNSGFNNEDDLSPMAHTLGGTNTVKFNSWSNELRLNGDLFADRLHYTLGGFMMDQDIFYTARQDLRYTPGSALVFVSGDPVPSFTRAGFAHLAFDVTSRLTATAGVRYTKEGKDYTYRRRDRYGNPLTGQNALLDGKTGQYRGDRWDYRAAVAYQVTDTVNTYVQYSTGFKGGGVNPRPFAYTQVQPFGPETLNTWEVGVKSELLDRRVRLNLAAYSSKYNDIQLILNTCPQFNPPPLPPSVAFPCGLPANVGTARIKGFEAETSIRPVAGLIIDGALSYIDFNYLSIQPAAGGPTNPRGVQFGMVPPYTPEWKWSLGAQYEVLAGNIGSFTPRIDVSHQSTIFGVAINAPKNRIDAYTVANARLTWRNASDDLEASLEVTNLFDKYYFLTTVEISGPAGANAQPARPREWALTVKKKF